MILGSKIHHHKNHPKLSSISFAESLYMIWWLSIKHIMILIKVSKTKKNNNIIIIIIIIIIITIPITLFLPTRSCWSPEKWLVRSPNRVKHMMLVLWHLRDGGSLEIRDLGLSENDKKRNGGGRKTRGKTTVVVGKHGENTLKTVEPPKKRGRLQTLGQLDVCSGKYGTLSPAGKQPRQLRKDLLVSKGEVWLRAFFDEG